jgi:hypothetical protein
MKKNINLEIHDLLSQDCELYTFKESILNIKLMKKELDEKLKNMLIKKTNKNKINKKINKKNQHDKINNIEPYVESCVRQPIVSKEI